MQTLSLSDNTHFDVIIIGGSYAGLSAAMALGRSLRNVLIIDSGLPCNRQTPHSHNFITQDGSTPEEIAILARQQVKKYQTVKFHHGLAINGEKKEDGFTISLHAGEIFFGKKLIFATGIRDLLPDICGFDECWGISVVHCPYCHGYEYRNQKTGILANGDKAMHLASLVNNLTSDLTLLTNGTANFTDEQRAKIDRHKIQIIDTPLSEIVHEQGHVKHVIFRDDSRMSFNAIYASVPFEQHSDIPVSLGCLLTEQGYIQIDPFHKCAVEGIYACGDNSAFMRSVANAVAGGNFTGAVVNRELTEETF